MYKPIKPISTKIALLFMMFLLLPSFYVEAQEKTEPGAVLLVYDSLAVGTDNEGNIEALQRLLAGFGVTVTLLARDGYRAGDMQHFNKVIGLVNASDMADSSQAYTDDLSHFAGDYLHIGGNVPAMVSTKLHLNLIQGGQDSVKLTVRSFTESSIRVQDTAYIEQSEGKAYGEITSGSIAVASPYGVIHEGIAYIPFFRSKHLSEWAMSDVLRDWLGITAESQSYVAFKDIYPFSDLELLVKLADRLYDAGIPFIASVSPVFDNTDYPAMKRYLETLKYVQARNGTILVNAPAVASTISELDRDLKKQMELFIDTLADYGIAPLGIGAEMYWSYDQLYVDHAMTLFDSALLFPNEKVMHKARTNTSYAFPSSLYSVQPDEWANYEDKGKVIEPLPMDTVITIPFFTNEEELGRGVQALMNSWLIFADYKAREHKVQTANHVITSRSGMLQVNGESLSLISERTSISSEYVYAPEAEQSFVKWFAVQNKLFIGIILIAISAFTVFFFLGSRMYKRKYYK
ncbi:DUF2334 domain-containing protein [Paenibacillus sinopodophylli]|uniref:DUF2334 domain-containing protein n=1 Tax=Paenibacillus sinopodophylli TaxID=1837342 RepID=UPI001486F5B4|nr:DUF2334 domain-containing protein [Paenibacillus sinopodophylli]